MRTLTLVGRIKNPRILELALRCAWCRKWDSLGDYIAAHKNGARVSHTICKRCARKFEAQSVTSTRPPEPNAA